MLRRIFAGVLLLVSASFAQKALELGASAVAARLAKASTAIGQPLMIAVAGLEALAAPGRAAEAEAARPPIWLEHGAEKGDRLDLARPSGAVRQRLTSHQK